MEVNPPHCVCSFSSTSIPDISFGNSACTCAYCSKSPAPLQISQRLSFTCLSLHLVFRELSSPWRLFSWWKDFALVPCITMFPFFSVMIMESEALLTISESSTDSYFLGLVKSNSILTWHFCYMVSYQPIATVCDLVDLTVLYNKQHYCSCSWLWNPKEGKQKDTEPYSTHPELSNFIFFKKYVLIFKTLQLCVYL